MTRDEVTAFREVFRISRADEAGAAKVFNLARQDTAGFEDYAARVARMFGRNADTLHDLMEGLFHIAMADGAYHPNEDEFLSCVAGIFGIPGPDFRSLKGRFVMDAEPDPYEVLGATPDMSFDEIRRRWRDKVRDCHPDRMQARGVPQEAIKLAQKRMADINRAWEEINASREDTREDAR